MQPEISILCLYGCIKFLFSKTKLGNHEFPLCVYMVASYSYATRNFHFLFIWLHKILFSKNVRQP